MFDKNAKGDIMKNVESFDKLAHHTLDEMSQVLKKTILFSPQNRR